MIDAEHLRVLHYEHERKQRKMMIRHQDSRRKKSGIRAVQLSMAY